MNKLLVPFLLFLSASMLHADERALVDKPQVIPARVTQIDQVNRGILIDDSWVFFNRSTPLRRYGDESRMTWSSVKNGDWLIIDSQYVRSERRYIIESAEYVPFDQVIYLINRDADDAE